MASDDGRGGEFERRREIGRDVLRHRMRGHHAGAQIPVQQPIQIDAELNDQRPVEAKLFAHAGNHVRRSVIAHDGDDGINRHHAADQEGNQDKPEQRDRHRTCGARDGAKPRAH